MGTWMERLASCINHDTLSPGPNRWIALIDALCCNHFALERYCDEEAMLVPAIETGPAYHCSCARGVVPPKAALLITQLAEAPEIPEAMTGGLIFAELTIIRTRRRVGNRNAERAQHSSVFVTAVS